MNVAELRAELSKYPDDVEVLRDDDEGGPCGVTSVRSVLYPQWSPKVRKVMKQYGVEPGPAVILE